MSLGFYCARVSSEEGVMEISSYSDFIEKIGWFFCMRRLLLYGRWLDQDFLSGSISTLWADKVVAVT